MDQYTYDAWNRLVKVQKAYRVATSDGQGGVTLGDVQLGSVVSEMRYDGLGRRIEKKIENSADLDCTYDYYYNGQHLIQTYDGSGNLIKQYVWGNAVGGYVDDLVRIGSSDVGGGIIDVYDWVLQGPNYDVRGVIDSTGDLIERYTYTPYGQRRVFTSAGSNDAGLHARALMSQRVNVFDIPQPYALNPFGHQGLMHDEVLGLIYNRTREVDPDLGFIQRDPLGYADGMNLHQYEDSGPVGWVDWMGLYKSGDVRYIETQYNVEPYGKNPELNEAQNQLIELAGEVGIMSRVAAAIQAGAAYPEIAEIIKSAAGAVVDDSTTYGAQELAKLAKELQNSFLSGFGGNELFTRIKYQEYECRVGLSYLFHYFGSEQHWVTKYDHWKPFEGVSDNAAIDNPNKSKLIGPNDYSTVSDAWKDAAIAGEEHHKQWEKAHAGHVVQ